MALYAIDAGPDQDLTCGVQANPPTLGGAPLPATANATYSWSPRYGLNDPTSPNPKVVRVGGPITYTLTVTINGQTFTDQVTINASGVCPCAHTYQHLATGPNAYQAGLTSMTNQPYELGTANQLTTIDASQYPNSEVTFDGTYHVLGPLAIANGTARLLPGTTFYVDADEAYLVASSCYPAVGLDEYASRIYVGRDGVLALDEATLTSTCERLWGGVTLTQNGRLLAGPGSVIRDAYVGVMAGEYCANNTHTHYFVDKTRFINCRYGFMDLEKQEVEPGEGLTNCTFTSDPATMLAPFPGEYTDTGLTIDGKDLQDLQLHDNAFDNLLSGANLGGANSLLAHNTFTRCFFRAIGVGVYLGGGSYVRKPTVHDNTITVPNDAFSNPQLSATDAVAGIVLNDANSTLITVTGNHITGAGSSPTATTKPQVGIIGYSFGQLDINRQNTVKNLDYGVQLQDVGLYQCPTPGNTCTAPGPVPTMTVADNNLADNTYNVYLQGNAYYNYGLPRVACNAMDNASLGGFTYGIYLAPNTYLPDLGSTNEPGGNQFSNISRSVWNNSGNGTNYWRYSTENTTGSGGINILQLLVSNLDPITQGCDDRDYGYSVGINSRQAAPTAQVVSGWQQQLLTKRGSLHERWYVEQDLLRYYHANGQQPALHRFLQTLALYNDSAFFRLGFYLLGHYQRTGQDSAALRLRPWLLAYGAGHPGVASTLAYQEAMHHLRTARHGLSPADSIRLARVAASGTEMAGPACLTLRTFYPHCQCAAGMPSALPREAAHPAVTLAKPRLHGLYPNPAADQVRIQCADVTGLGIWEIIVRDLRTGQAVSQAKLVADKQEAILDVQTLSAGLYACQLVQDGRVVAVQRLQIAR